MIARGLPAPDDAHKVIEIGGEFVEADLFYAHGSVCVFCDGAPHDQETVAAADERKRAQLKNRGYKVVAVVYRDVDKGLDELSLRLGL
jgi:very-short-patch-repair endonuclease